MGTIPKLRLVDGRVYTSGPVFLAKTEPVEEYIELPDYDWAAYERGGGEQGKKSLKPYEPTRYGTYLPKAEDGVKIDGFVIDEPEREIEIDNYQSPFEQEKNLQAEQQKKQ